VICGRSEELKRRLDELAAAQRAAYPARLTIVGYTTVMGECTADLLVGPPGGLTTSEALARGLCALEHLADWFHPHAL
jgi:processive 1,2-diacylglycerol beta-glucosyltransferase